MRKVAPPRRKDEMVFVLFEVKVKEEGVNAYLALAAGLRDELEHAEGFIRSERFTSLVNEGKILSLSVWESEKAVEKWRNTDRPPKKECRTCCHSGRYQSYGYQTHYWCGLHGFNVAAKGKCNNFERIK